MIRGWSSPAIHLDPDAACSVRPLRLVHHCARCCKNDLWNVLTVPGHKSDGEPDVANDGPRKRSNSEQDHGGWLIPPEPGRDRVYDEHCLTCVIGCINGLGIGQRMIVVLLYGYGDSCRRFHQPVPHQLAKVVCESAGASGGSCRTQCQPDLKLCAESTWKGKGLAGHGVDEVK